MAAAAMAGAVVSKPTARNTVSRPESAGDLQGVER